MRHPLLSSLLLTALALPTMACDRIADAFCGGTLEEWCADHDCTWTWEEALIKAESDTGDFELIGCTEEAMLMSHGYLHGRTHYYDGATGELSAVVEYGDVMDYCSGTSTSREWGERLDCDWSCTYEEEEASENRPLCEDAEGAR
jgi:hypothetical protein